MIGSAQFRRRAVVTTALLSVLAAVLPPTAYFAVSYQYLRGTLDAQAEMSARTISNLVTANPRTWHFEQLRLSELLERRPLTQDPQVRRVIDAAGNLVAEHADRLASPLLVRGRAVHDAGLAVGRIEVAQSLRPLLARAALVGGVTTILGLAVFVAFGYYPLRIAREALASRAQSERLYRSLYLSMKEGMVLFRVRRAPGGGPGELEFLEANPALEAMLGVAGAGLGAAPSARFLQSALLARLAGDGGAADGGALKFEAEAEGGLRVCSVSVFSPEPGLFAALVEDLTEVRRERQEREAMERRMQQSQKLESLGILAGGIAHDFNNLLVGMLGNLDLALVQTGPDSPAGASLQRAENAARRAADLVNQMLAYSGRGRFVVERVDLSRLVAEMGSLLSAALSKTARLRLGLAAGLRPVEGDATQLRQVVMNLLTNASDAIGERDGVIDVTTGSVEADRASLDGALFGDTLYPGEYVYLEVADTGRGMDAGTSARIFDPFFTTKGQGRGLGLAAALGIVRSHRGTLSVRSAPGAGTCIRVLFPAAEGAVPAEDAASGERPGGAVAAEPAAAAGTVLVVDDEEAVRKVARDILEAQRFAVLTACDGQEGIEALHAHRDEVAAVLLDLTMPRMGGLEASREMRRIAPGVPVILCSGYTEGEISEEAAADGFLQKPFRLQALVSTVAGAIARSRRRQVAAPPA
ncbi:MAG TPA: response regulator [bacterium]